MFLPLVYIYHQLPVQFKMNVSQWVKKSSLLFYKLLKGFWQKSCLLENFISTHHLHGPQNENNDKPFNLIQICNFNYHNFKGILIFQFLEMPTANPGIGGLIPGFAIHLFWLELGIRKTVYQNIMSSIACILGDNALY